MHAELRNVLRKKGNKPHVFLFVDRMDESRSQEVDAGLLAAAYQVLGRGQIYHTIGVLTHAACKPPDTKAGALEYEAWSTPRTRALQFTMMVTSGDRTAQHFTALAENHPACRVVEGEPVLPNGTRWAPHLLDIMLMFLGLRMGMDVPRPKKKKVKGAPAQQRGMDIRRLLGVRVTPPACVRVCAGAVPQHASVSVALLWCHHAAGFSRSCDVGSCANRAGASSEAVRCTAELACRVPGRRRCL